MFSRRTVVMVLVLTFSTSLLLLLPTAAPAMAGRALDKSIQAMMGFVNARLEANNENYRLGVVEYITSGHDEQIGRTVFFKFTGDKRLEEHFVPGDPRRGGLTDISWINDWSEGSTTSGLGPAQTAAAIRRAMETWNLQKCATIPLIDFGDTNLDLGVVQYILNFGGSTSVAADITHAGWVPPEFFDTLVPGGGDLILAVTFTFWFVDLNGDITDIDGNGLLDVSFREIYYNDSQNWGIDAPVWGPPPNVPNSPPQPPVDVETIALHEIGHGLSLDHWGKAFQDAGNGMVHLAPFALMNPVLWALQQDLEGTDMAAFCGVWSSWPSK